MSTAWANFARTGNPSNKIIGEWLPYDPELRQTMVFDVNNRLERDPLRAERMAMLNFRSVRLAETAERHYGYSGIFDESRD